VLYRQAYDMLPSAFFAGRVIHCLRKQGVGPAREACFFAREPRKQWPDDEWLKREYVWAIYFGYLKSEEAPDDDGEEVPNEVGPEFEHMRRAARRILDVTDEELPRRLAIFAVGKAARRREQWETVLEFVSELSPERLSDDDRQHDGRSYPSDRLRWYYWMTRSHLEQNHWNEALTLAEAGLRQFEDDQFLQWWRAQALVGLERVEEGLAGLELVNLRYPSHWYVLRSMAQVYSQLGRMEDAWRCYCEAAATPGDQKNRIRMLEEMASLLVEQERVETAFDHLLLVWGLSARERDWDRPTERRQLALLDLAFEHQEKLQGSRSVPEAPPPLPALLRQCQSVWAQVVRDALPKDTGHIKQFHPERGYGFIERGNGSDLHFTRRDFLARDRDLAAGLAVEFRIRKSYDRRRNCESWSAVYVTPRSV
jgi:cold shock CspA family protein/tetratricopeptide (TPR) repeat protein